MGSKVWDTALLSDSLDWSRDSPGSKIGLTLCSDRSWHLSECWYLVRDTQGLRQSCSLPILWDWAGSSSKYQTWLSHCSIPKNSLGSQIWDTRAPLSEDVQLWTSALPPFPVACAHLKRYPTHRAEDERAFPIPCYMWPFKGVSSVSSGKYGSSPIPNCTCKAPL